MTDPVAALAYSPYQQNPDTIPSWRKAAYQASYAQQQQQNIANSPYSASGQTNIPGMLSQSQQALMQSGTNQTQNVEAAAATNQGYQKQYQQDLFNYNQLKAQNATSAATSTALGALNTKYADLGNQQQGWYTSILNQINNGGQPGSWTAPSSTGGAQGFAGNGATSSGGPITYSGQAWQVAQMARNAGFSEADIPTVVAISQAESSGRANAVNNANTNGTSDYGLMQINSVHSDLLGKYDWKDPQQNLDMAYQIYKDAGNSFTPWSTYNSGDYNKFMNIGNGAASAIIPAGPVGVTSQTTSGLRQTIITKAETYIGLPYVWGGTDLSKGVDCSGLVQQVYAKFGISLPRTSYGQYGATAGGGATWGVRTNVSQLEPGDLVYFKHSDGTVHHVAIWLGNNQILEAPYTGADVRVRTLGKNDVPYGVHLYGLDSSGSKATGKNNPVAV